MTYRSIMNANVLNSNGNPNSAYNAYVDGQGVITFDGVVTSIGPSAFQYCSSLKSVEIPSNVTSIGAWAIFDCGSLQKIAIPANVMEIGKYAFSNCNSMTTVTFNSFPIVGTEAFWPCNSLSNRILDLTDSDKPFIGNTLNDYHPFTAAHYHGTLEPNQWGTIVLPFVPSSHSGIVFFSIDKVDAANGTLTLSMVENIEAGKPYLFRNQTEDTNFTLTAMPAAPATNVPVIINASEQTVGNFALKGTFQANELTESGLYGQQGNKFGHTDKLSIDPFCAYLKNNGGSAAQTIVINGGIDFVEITKQDGNVVTLYGLKRVEFIKQNGIPAVRVTHNDETTETYENPKNVEFGKQ